MINISNYRQLKKDTKISDNLEPMIDISSKFELFSPHHYLECGADYLGMSPFYLRKTVVDKLISAQIYLDSLHKGFKLKIFDAYRPIFVQEYMIEFDRNKYSKKKYNMDFIGLDEIKQQEMTDFILLFWSPVHKDVTLNPPPHSTGGALDLTIIDEDGFALDMGTKIDELSVESNSDFYADFNNGKEVMFQKNRELLNDVMSTVGFCRLPTEWWHFSYGDQIWTANENLKTGRKDSAIYGIVKL